MSLAADLRDGVERAARRHGVPGAAVAVGVGDDLAEVATGVINRETGVDTTPDTLFQIGSVTKVWTAALVLQLVAEGRVDLDAPVRRYLPAFATTDPDASGRITVRHLLTHTGGFDGDLFTDTGRGDDAVTRLIAHMRDDARQVSAPGELFSYNNAGYCALGALVAGLRGSTWEAAMREHLIDPLGARHMALYAEEAIMFRAAAGHVGDPPRLSPRWQLPQSNAPAGSTPAAAPRDLVRFGRMLLADGVAADGTRVLPAGTFAAMCRPQVTLPPLGPRQPAAWGLGLMLFDVAGQTVAGHDGTTPGQATAWRVVPGRDLVLAVNANGGHAKAFVDDVLTHVLSSVAGIDLPPRLRPPDTPVPFDPGTYAGTYAAPLATYEVTDGPDGLHVTDVPHGVAAEVGDGGTTARYVHTGGGRFVAAEPDQGLHPVIAFLHGGRFLYNLRAVARVAG